MGSGDMGGWVVGIWEGGYGIWVRVINYTIINLLPTLLILNPNNWVIREVSENPSFVIKSILLPYSPI